MSLFPNFFKRLAGLFSKELIDVRADLSSIEHRLRKLELSLPSATTIKNDLIKLEQDIKNLKNSTWAQVRGLEQSVNKLEGKL